MPHDKVVVNEGVLSETVVYETGNFTEEGKPLHAETLRPLQDPLIIRYLELSELLNNVEKDPFKSEQRGATPNHTDKQLPMGSRLVRWARNLRAKTHNTLYNLLGGQMIYYCPTVALTVLDMLAAYFPRHHLVLIDFDNLPSGVPGVNAPLVQRKYLVDEDRGSSNKHYVSRSFDTYLVPKGTCDIFFPTDFLTLQLVYNKLCRRTNSTVLKHSEFIRKFARNDKLTCTRDGYNPMFQDYRNMSVFLS